MLGLSAFPSHISLYAQEAGGLGRYVILNVWMGEPRRNGVITPKSLPYVLPTDTLASPGLSLGRGLLPEPVPGQAAAPAAEQDEEGSKGCRPPQAPWELPLIPAPAPEKEPGPALR